MTSTTAEQAAPASPAAGHEPTARKKATVTPQKPRVAPSKAEASKNASPAKKAPKSPRNAKTAKPKGPEGSKTAQVIAMLRRRDGATMTEIMQRIGWQRHTVRGFMAGAMKKAGFTVESFKPEGGERTYRINQ
jgi:hypothetical protein